MSSDSSIIFSIGNPLLNSTRRSILISPELPLPSFLTLTEDSAEDVPQLTTPNLSDYELSSFLRDTSPETSNSVHLAALPAASTAVDSHAEPSVDAIEAANPLY